MHLLACKVVSSCITFSSDAITRAGLWEAKFLVDYLLVYRMSVEVDGKLERLKKRFIYNNFIQEL